MTEQLGADPGMLEVALDPGAEARDSGQQPCGPGRPRQHHQRSPRRAQRRLDLADVMKQRGLPEPRLGVAEAPQDAQSVYLVPSRHAQE